MNNGLWIIALNQTAIISQGNNKAAWQIYRPPSIVFASSLRLPLSYSSGKVALPVRLHLLAVCNRIKLRATLNMQKRKKKVYSFTPSCHNSNIQLWDPCNCCQGHQFWIRVNVDLSILLVFVSQWMVLLYCCLLWDRKSKKPGTMLDKHLALKNIFGSFSCRISKANNAPTIVGHLASFHESAALLS